MSHLRRGCIQSCLAHWRALVLVLTWSVVAFGAEVAFNGSTAVEFAAEQTAAEALRRVDLFVQSLSPFDRSARLKTGQQVDRDEFLKFVSAQARSWDPEEVRNITKSLLSASNRCARLAWRLPERILFVKTTGAEEGNAAYCRSTNVVVIPQDKSRNERLEEILLHELFHIFSRNNPAAREKLYGILGFKPCAEVPFPKELDHRKLTNPDAPRNEHYLEVMADEQSVAVVPMIYSRTDRYDPAEGKNFFAYLTFRLMALEKTDGRYAPKYAAGNLVWFEPNQVSQFFEQIGRNTNYIVHPEEVLADNFVLMLTRDGGVPTPRILAEMKELFSMR